MRCIKSEQLRLNRKKRQREAIFYIGNSLFILTSVGFAIYKLVSG